MSVDEELKEFRHWDELLRNSVSKIILGQASAIDASTCALLAGGHLMHVGVPGTGKTRLAECLALGMGLQKGRIQFTPDLLPADILGAETLITGESGDRIEFRPGPIFRQLVVADEINRGTPRTQSALLEAMQERSITVAGTRHRLDPLFGVIATRNPIEMEGTYPLPEAQRDRFLMEVVLTSPDAETLSKIAALTTINEEQQMESCFTPSTFSKLRETVRKVIAAPAVLDRAARWIAATRPEDPTAPESVRKGVRLGAGARALQALILCGKVEALRAGRTHLADEDWQTWREEIIRHRLVMSLEGELQGLQVSEIVRTVDKEVR